MPDTAVDPEFCPKAALPRTIHSESWYDCKPCDRCGNDSVPESCDCGRPSHAPGMGHLALPIKVSIDVADDSNLGAEAKEAGCEATKTTEFCMAYTSVYHVTGPRDLLLALLEEWGYPDEGDYTVIEEQEDEGPCCIAFVTSGGRDEHVPGCTEELKR